MKRYSVLSSLSVVAFLAALWPAPPAQAAPESNAKIRVLIVTGGHDFDPEGFFAMFNNNPDITYRAVEHPHAHALYKADAAKEYDVVLAYDLCQDISEEAKADFVNLIKGGKGLVVVHHGIGSYLDWPEWWKMMGARWYHVKTVVDGVEKFSYPSDSNDVHFRIHIADPNHPVTRGLHDYDMIDETYKAFDVFPDSHTLLTSDDPASNKIIGWCKNYGEGRVVCFQSGHGPNAYVNPNYQLLVRQAIRWVAKRD